MAKTKSLYLITQKLDSIAGEDGCLISSSKGKWIVLLEKRWQLKIPGVWSLCAAAENAALNRLFTLRENQSVYLSKGPQGEYIIKIDGFPCVGSTLATLVPRANYLALVRRQRQAEVADAMHALKQYCDFSLTKEQALQLNRKATMLLARFLPSDGVVRQQEPEDPSGVLDYPTLTTAYPAYAVALGLVNP